jgi:multiple sugar transport system permease protein
LTLLSRQDLQPATVGIYSFVGAEYAGWSCVMAFSPVFVVLVLILFLALQRRIVAGLAAGALK